jgi:hypothetical protein
VQVALEVVPTHIQEFLEEILYLIQQQQLVEAEVRQYLLMV